VLPADAAVRTITRLGPRDCDAPGGVPAQAVRTKIALTTLGKLLFGGLVALLVVALVVMGVTIWWAKTVVATADTALWVERENVKAAKAYAETIKKALDRKTQEAESLRAECERLKARQTQKQ